MPIHHNAHLEYEANQEYDYRHAHDAYNEAAYHHHDAHRRPPPLALQQSSMGSLGHSGAPPATPRTMAMQQHALQLQQRIRGSHGNGGLTNGMLSPRAADFGLNATGIMKRVPSGLSADAMLVSPSATQFVGGIVDDRSRLHHEGPGSLDETSQRALQFSEGFLEGALDPSVADGRESSTYGSRSFSADDAGRRGTSDAWPTLSGNAVAQPGDMRGAPGASYQSGSQDLFALGNSGHQQSYSALGEIAAGSANQMMDAPPGTDFYNLQTEMTFEPDAEVAYVFLDSKQAQDTALVDSIRAQGFGITFDAGADDLAAMSGGVMAR